AAILGRKRLPFASLEAHVARSVESWLRPELRGRFGRPFVFRPLNREVQREIAQDNLNELLAFNQRQGRNISTAPEVLPFLVCRGFSDRLGARPILQLIEELCGNAIKDGLNDGLLCNGTGCGTLTVCGNILKLV